MGLKLTDTGYGKELVYSIQATAYIDRETVEGLTTEQLARLEHHVTEVSRRVFTASVAGHGEGLCGSTGRSLGLTARSGAHFTRSPAVRCVSGSRTSFRRRWTAPIKPDAYCADALGVELLPDRQLTLDEARTDGRIQALCYACGHVPLGKLPLVCSVPNAAQNRPRTPAVGSCNTRTASW